MSSSALLRTASYVLVLVLSVLLAVWGAFLVLLRVRGVPVPVGLLLALAPVVLCRAGGRLLESRAGAAGPALVWVATALLLGSRRPEGDLVVTGGLLGLTFLTLGTLSSAVAVGMFRPRPAETTDASPGAR